MDDRDGSENRRAAGAAAAGARREDEGRPEEAARRPRARLSAQNIKVSPFRRPAPEAEPVPEGSVETLAEAPDAAAQDRRSAAARRRRTLLSAKVIYNESQSVLNCTVRDLSRTGAKLVFQMAPNCPRTFDLVLSSGSVRRCETVYRRENTLGVRFLGVEAGS